MGSFSIWHWLIVLAVVLVLFGGRGRLSQIMADFGKGLRAFKKSVSEDEEPMADADEPGRPRSLPGDRAAVGDTARDRDRATHS